MQNRKKGSSAINMNFLFIILFFFDWDSLQEGWTATTRYGVTRKRNTKRLRHAGNLFRKNPQLKDVS